MKVRKIVSLFTAILLCIIVSSAAAELKPPAEVSQKDGYLIFGSFEQWRNDIDGLELIDNGPEPIEWLILDKNDNNLLLVSKYPLEYLQYNSQKGNYSWKDSDLRKWLNGPFIEKAFTSEEQAAIVTTKVETGGESFEPSWPILTKISTDDKVFLLSYSEMKKYLNNDKVLVNDYLSPKGGSIFADDDSWWLRSSGKNDQEACYVGHSKCESGWLTDWRCVRPALWIDITAFDWEQSLFNRAMNSYKLGEEKKYDKAYEITDTLGSYWCSKLESVQYRYDDACKSYDEKDYKSAIEKLTALKNHIVSNFSESNEYSENEVTTLINYFDIHFGILECKYQYACQMMDLGELDNAISLFEEIGQYGDSMDLLLECYNKKHIQYSWLTKPNAAINAGLDKEFAEIHEIVGNDPHYGWSLGRFLISGFTEEKANGSVPVYIKTPGDNLKLWFILDQNIDALDGKTNLRINNDSNGMDRQFGVKASNFGRGMLIVRHTDFRNNPTSPQLYQNYLLASDETGANTKVEIKEEGIYEVALDYEIIKDELFDSFFNYRIAFSFEVRNGSGMFFMFDIETGSELQDYSRTSEGFRIDLANSHSLSVSYTRYALNQDETALDVRKTGLAQDGDIFDKVGYYEITVTNKETGEELKKHIFVGRAADLSDYQAVDDSLAKFAK